MVTPRYVQRTIPCYIVTKHMEEFISIQRVNFIFQTRLSKILTIKKDWITQLKDMNTEAEKKVRPNKKICVFQVTCNFKIGTVGRKIFYFVKSFYMGKIEKQDGRPGKSLGIPLNMLKNIMVGGKKLGTVG